jgi:hypothetical protein
VGIVDEAVQDGIGECGVSDHRMPVFEWELAGEEGGASAVAVFEDLEEVAALGVGEGGEAEVIEDEELGPGQAVEELGVGAVRAGQGQFSEEPGEAIVAGGEAVTAGTVAEGAGQVALAGAGGAGDEDALVVADPVTAGEAQNQGAIQSAGTAEVEVLHDGREMELGELKESGEAAIIAEGDLAFQEQSQAVLEGEAVHVGHAPLLFEGLGHTGEAKFVELIESLLSQHGSSPLAEAAA